MRGKRKRVRRTGKRVFLQGFVAARRHRRVEAGPVSKSAAGVRPPRPF